jgi:hypothetical protein
MNARPPDGSDGPEAVDQVMLAVLSNRGRDATLLSADQERLVDDWVAGRLAPDDAERAAALVRQNALAAERVLERRLQVAASESPPVPQQLAAQILKASAPPKTSAPGAWWRSLGRWQWTSIAVGAALASILVVAGMPLLQQMMSGGGPLQVAMVTISDRGPLFEASDLRMRGTTPPPGPVTGERFRDVEMPTALLKDLVAMTGQPKSATAREIERHVLGTGETTDRPIRLIVDSSLKQRIETDDRDRMLVRVYDLGDPRSADVRNLVGLPSANERAFLLTVRP